MRLRRWTGLALLFPLAAGCSQQAVQAGSSSPPDEVPAPWFDEAAAERGLRFEHRSGHDGENYLFPEILGAGAALFDMDNDGDLDAYLVQAGSLTGASPSAGNQLFANDGGGRFEDVSAGSGADDRGYGMGVASGDCNEDGVVDLYVTNLRANVLLLGDGSGRFEERAEGAGCADRSWSTSAAFLDFDRDGDLDLFVANYIDWSLADEVRCEVPPLGYDYCSPKAYGAPAPDSLFRNRGDGTFDDVSAPLGLRAAFGNGLGVLPGDFDDDGWPDVLVANDGTLNQLWINRREGGFVDLALEMGCAADEHGTAKAGMGVAAADWDGDLDEDLLIVNLASESDSFYRNDGTYFSDRTAIAGLASASRPYTRFGCALLDFDQDGQLDLFEANGRVARSEESHADGYAQVNRLLRGTASGRFEPLPGDGTIRPTAATSRAAAFGDVNGDGSVDVLVANRDGLAQLYINRNPGKGNWIRFALKEASGRPALGARIQVEIEGRTRMARVRSAYSYAAANDPEVHFGLGSAELVRGVQVRWVDGTLETFGEFPAGARISLRRGAGAVQPR